MNFDFRSKRYRESFVSAFVRQGIALQIQLLRKREQWSQKKLGELADKKQNAIARLEDPSYGKFTITTLLELAKAFDVALSIRFIPFSELEAQGRKLNPDDLTVARYADENPPIAENITRPRRPGIIDASEISLYVQKATQTGLNLRIATSPRSGSILAATGN